MALDGAFLHFIKNELNTELLNTKVDKIYQPSKDELVLSMRSREGTKKLLISARPNSPRINITSASYENPKTPPMLCMLLRKRLSGARLRDIVQPQLERLLILEFEGLNELGDTVTMKLAAEIMGQYSNIIFIDDDNNIIDAVKRVDPTMSSQRLVLPGIAYSLPPAQQKLSVLENDADDIICALGALPKTTLLSKGLLSVMQGMSPIICRELEHLAGRGRDVFISDLGNEEIVTRLRFFLKRMIASVREGTGEPFIITDSTNKPIDFTFMNIQQYGSGRSVKESDSFCELLDRYYSKKDALETIRRKSEDLNKLMNNTASRLIKKIYVQKDELSACADREHLRICGDIIQANLYRVEKGSTELVAENFYDNMKPITVPLDPALSAAANSQRYYKSYRKAKNAEQVLKIQIEKAEAELDYVSSVLDSLSRAESIRELEEIRAELTEEGYLRSKGKKQKPEAALPPLTFTSESGFTILVGRNNRQNDRLTLKQAGKNDLWFHTKDIPGSHTVIITEGREPDEGTIIYAASLAAGHSKAKEAGKVPVDYTRIRYVSKPQGAKPGMVIYTNQKTLFVEPISG